MRVRHKLTQAIIFSSILAVNLAFAASASAASETDDSKAIFMWVIGGLCTLLFSISAFALSKVDRNQNRLFERQDEFSERLTRIETKCEIESCRD